VYSTVSHFKSDTLAEIFSDLYHMERSGTLTLKRGDLVKRLHFDRGMIVYAESAVADESLEAVLVGDGRISTGALAEAGSSVEGPAGPREFAEALVRRDLIGRASISQAMTKIVERVVCSAFRWEEGEFDFTEGTGDETVFETNILATVQVILGGVFGMSAFEAVRDAMAALDNRLRTCESVPIPIERLTLSATHGFVLSRVDGKTSINDLLSILPPEEEDAAARFLFGLLVLRVLELDPPLESGPFRAHHLVRDHVDRQSTERTQERAIRQKYEQVTNQNPYEVLGVGTSATHDEVARAYEQLKAQYGRDQLTPKIRDQFGAQVAVIESRLVEAYLTLSQPTHVKPRRTAIAGVRKTGPVANDFAVRVELDRTQVKVEADQQHEVADNYYAKARRCMREADFHNAIQYGKLAISHNGSDARYFCLLADCQARNPGGRWQRMAEENYRRATQLDPWNPDYWLHLGRLYKKRGMKVRARRNLEEALKLSPNKADILDELSSLEP